MNSLKKPEESGSKLPESKQPNQPLKSELIKSFNKFFKSAENKTSQSVEKTNDIKEKPKASPSDKPRTEADLSKQFKFTKKEGDIQHLFSELGTSITDQLDQVLINITNQIEKVFQTNEVSQQFFIKFSDKSLPIQINITNSANNSKLNIKCDSELCQLLLRYLPELKQHLRKKSLNFDDIIIEDETENKSNTNNEK